MVRSAYMDQSAKLGASVRLREIQEELAAIYRAFPDSKGQQGLAPIARRGDGGREAASRPKADGRLAKACGSIGPDQKPRQPRP